MKILFLDDEQGRFEIFKTRFPPEVELVFCATLQEGLAELQKHVDGTTYYDVLHFDHDMLDPVTNYSCKHWTNIRIKRWQDQVMNSLLTCLM